jgi:hypothetical protein
MQELNDIFSEARHEHHRFPIRENICSENDGRMDHLSESLPKMIRNMSLSYKYVDRGKTNGDLLQQEKSSEK